ncbi:MAG: hypothetical protein IJC45_03815, partial [Clostridia bacterium]|nr:hypothetical protein [Clostridia bacterium]
MGQMPDQVYKIVNMKDHAELLYSYDDLGRVTREETNIYNNPSLVSTYTYKDVDSTRTTSLVSSHSNKLGTYAYTYDSVGNITSFTFTPAGSGQSKSVYYTYNSSNQLTREDNQFANKTFVYFVT